MAFALQISATQYVGNNSNSVPYPVEFPVISLDHLAVSVQVPGQPLLVLDPQQFTKHSLGPGLYEITTTVPWPATDVVTIFRDVPFDQPFEFPEGSIFRTREIERAFDRVVMQVHQIWRLITGGAGGTILPGSGSPVKSVAVFADESVRAIISGSYAGQIGVQLSDETLWIARSTAVGDWHNPFLDAAAITLLIDQRLGKDSLIKLAEWNYLAGTGQSLAAASDAAPLVNTAPVYGHLTFSTGPNYPALGSPLASSAALFERFTGSNQYETICSSFARAITENRIKVGLPDIITFHAVSALGGSSISQHMPGQSLNTRLISYYNAAKSLALAANKTFACGAVWILLGESDAFYNTTTESFLASLTTISDFLFAEMDGAHILTYQPVAYAAVGKGPALAYLEADNLPHIHLVTPIYFLTAGGASVNPNIHPDSAQMQKVGHYFGRAWHQLAIGREPDRIRISRVTQAGETKLYIWFTVPTLPLVFDLTTLPAVVNRGFKIIDDTGEVDISGVTISGSTVAIDCSRSIVGTAFVRYALDNNTTGWIGGGSGNLRDSTPDQAWIGEVLVPLPHWCPHFEQPAIKTLGGPLAALPELTAFEHWVFGGSSASLTGVKAGLVAVPMSGVTPNYNAVSIILPTGVSGNSYINGIQLPFTDRATWTAIMVFKRELWPDGYYVPVIGSLDIVNNTVGNEGSGLLQFEGSLNTGLIVRGQGPGCGAGLGGTAFQRDFSDAPAAVGDFVFAVFRSRDNFIGGKIGSGAFLEDSANSKTPAPGRNIGLGNCYVPYSNTINNLAFSDVMLFNRALSPTEMEGIHQRYITSQALKGVTIL